MFYGAFLKADFASRKKAEGPDQPRRCSRHASAPKVPSVETAYLLFKEDIMLFGLAESYYLGYLFVLSGVLSGTKPGFYFIRWLSKMIPMSYGSRRARRSAGRTKAGN